MGKSEADIKKRTKDVPKSPISPIWLGTSCCFLSPWNFSIPLPNPGPRPLSSPNEVVAKVQ